MNTILNLSGGIDSVYVAYKWLSEHPKEKLLIHHCSLRTYEYRWEKEDEAVKNVLEWLDNHGLTNYEYVETTLDVAEVHPHLWDSSMIAFMTGAVLTNPKYKNIKNVLSNTPKDEYSRLGHSLYNRINKADAIKYAVLKKKLTPIHMLKSVRKEQIIELIPPDLLELCWYCRRPTENGGTCHQCHTCRQVDEAQEKRNKKIKR